MNSRRGQAIRDITCKISEPKMTLKTLYMIFFLKSIKCMNTFRVVQFVYYEPVMRILCPKPSKFNIPFTSLYPRDIIWQIVILIVGRRCVFPYNDDDVVFTEIICTKNMTIDNKVTDLILTPLKAGLIHISLCLQCYVSMLDDLNLIVTAYDGLSMLFLSLFNSCIKPTLYDFP